MRLPGPVPGHCGEAGRRNTDLSITITVHGVKRICSKALTFDYLGETSYADRADHPEEVTPMSLGAYLKGIRDDRQLSLRDVERIAKEMGLGADVSSGYLSMLERNRVKEPSPRVLYTLAAVYEIQYLDLMRKAGYIPEDASLAGPPTTSFAFRGASQLSRDRRKRIQRMIEFELNEQREAKRRRNRRDADG